MESRDWTQLLRQGFHQEVITRRPLLKADRHDRLLTRLQQKSAHLDDQVLLSVRLLVLMWVLALVLLWVLELVLLWAPELAPLWWAH